MYIRNYDMINHSIKILYKTEIFVSCKKKRERKKVLYLNHESDHLFKRTEKYYMLKIYYELIYFYCNQCDYDYIAYCQDVLVLYCTME